MQQLILHIGPPKTGSTSIQTFLTSAQEELLSNGILYPIQGRLAAGETYGFYKTYNENRRRQRKGPSPAHHLLAWSVRKINGIDDDRYWFDVIDEIHSVKPNMTIISSEDFSACSQEQVAQVKKYLEDFDIKIIIYLRNPFKKMVSSYKHAIKNHNYSQSFSKFIEERCSTNVASHNYHLLVNRWVNEFGKEHVETKLFDKIVRNIGLEKDLLEILELDQSKFKRYMNPSPRNVASNDNVINKIRLQNVIEKSLGEKVIKKRFVQILLTAGKLFLGQSIYKNEDVLLAKMKIEEWYSEFLNTYVDPEDWAYFDF